MCGLSPNHGKRDMAVSALWDIVHFLQEDFQIRG